MAHRDKRESGVVEAERTALVVLGMHRSGTSALTGILSRMGADLPRELMAPTDMNVKGFFESQKMMLLNDALLESAGFSWSSLQRFPEDWFGSPKATEFRARAAQVLEDEFSGSYLFAMKDPRVCKLLPFWHRALEDANCRALHICVLRHPLDVAGSLTSRYDLETDYGLLMWLRHVLDAEAASRGKPRVFTSYERILEDWQREIKRLGEGLDLKWPRSLEMVTPEVLDFLSGELRHFAQPSEGARSRLAGGLDWIRQAYEIFERWAAEGESSADHPALDALRAGLDHAQGTLGAVAQHAQDQRAERQALRAQVDGLAADLQAARKDAAGHANNHLTEQRNRQSAEDRAAELEAALDLKQQSEQAKIAALSEAQTATEALKAQIAALQTERDQTRDESLRAEAEQAQLQEEMAAKSHEMHQLQSMLSQRGQELEDLHTQTRDMADELASLREELAVSEAERERFHRAHAHASRHLNELTRRASLAMRQELQARLDQTTREAQERQDAETAAQRLRELEQRLASLAAERDAARTHAQQVEEKMAAREAQAVSERKTLTGEKQESRSEADELRRSVQDMRASLETRERDAAKSATRGRELSEALTEQKRKVATLEAQLAAARAETAAQESRATEMLHSTSWRVTGPMRRLKILFSRGNP